MGFRSRKKAGVIGLGIIGSRVAENLRRAKFQTYVWNRTPKPVPNFLASPAAVAETCEILQIFVADPAALASVLEMLKPKLKPHHLVLNHATVSMEATAAAAELVSSTGANFLDAPFTGSKDAAAGAQIVYYIGGESAALERARPVLEASGRKVIHIGKTGDATLVKIAMNIMIAMQTQAMVEALALTTANGLDPTLFAEVLSENAARSGVSEMKLPKILVGDYETHFSIKHMLKDVEFGMKVAGECGLNLPATAVAGGALLQAMTEGHGDLDFSAIAKNFPFLIAQEPAETTSDEPAVDGPDEIHEIEEPTPEPMILAGSAEKSQEDEEAHLVAEEKKSTALLTPSTDESPEEEDAEAEPPGEKPKMGPPAGSLVFSASPHKSEDTTEVSPVLVKPTTSLSLPVIRSLPVVEKSAEPEELAPSEASPDRGEPEAAPLFQEKSTAGEPEPDEKAPSGEELREAGPIRISDLADDEERLVIRGEPEEAPFFQEKSIAGEPEPDEKAPSGEELREAGPIRISDLADDEERLVIAPPKPTITKKVSIWGRPGLFRARNED